MSDTGVQGRSFMIEPLAEELPRELAEHGVDVNAPSMDLDRSPVLCAPAALFPVRRRRCLMVGGRRRFAPWTRREAVTRAVGSTGEKER
jgi:hypothetical protein